MKAPDQLLREWPPGYGGVERVAHGLAAEQGGTVFSLLPPLAASDPLPVSYARRRIRSVCLGRLLLPLPSMIPRLAFAAIFSTPPLRL